AQFVSKGVPVTAVATFWQRTTLGLLGLDDTTIKVPKDIEGKRVGSTPTGVDPQVLPAFAGATGVDLGRVQIVNMPGEAKFAALLAGKVDLISADIPRFVILARTQGRQPRELYFADWGVNMLSYGIIVNNKFLHEKPDVVRRFLAATVK